MRKIILASLAAWLISFQAHAACNQNAARDVQLSMHEFATWRIEGDHLAVHWKYKIEKERETKQLQMVTTYANMDACLFGGAREIYFYRKGKMMGYALPSTGIKLTK